MSVGTTMMRLFATPQPLLCASRTAIPPHLREERLSLLREARQAIKDKRYDEAQRHYRKLERAARRLGSLSPNDLLNFGIAHRITGAFSSSARILRKAAKLEPLPVAWCELAISLKELGIHESYAGKNKAAMLHLYKALVAIETAITLNPKFARHYCEKALILLEIARLQTKLNSVDEAKQTYKDALDAIDTALEKNGHARHHCVRGIILSEMGVRYRDEARMSLYIGISRSEAKGIFFPEAYLAQAKLSESFENPVSAEALLGKLIKRLADSGRRLPPAYVEYIRILIKGRRFTIAKELLEKAASFGVSEQQIAELTKQLNGS